MKESVPAWPSSCPVPRTVEHEPSRRIRVAFVEDDEDYRESVSGELGDHGFDVTSFVVSSTCPRHFSCPTTPGTGSSATPARASTTQPSRSKCTRNVCRQH